MKFSTTFVALAGVSSANAALRGVLPAHMKELLNDKFAAVDEDTCSAFLDGKPACESTGECKQKYKEYKDEHETEASARGCSMTCNYTGSHGRICVQTDEKEEEEFANMKELLDDKYAAVVSSGNCKAVRNQLCKVGDNDYQCANAYGVENTCTAGAKVREIWGSFCAAITDASTKEEIHFVEEATAPGSSCNVLGEHDGCVPDWVTVGLKCKEGLTCVGYKAATHTGAADELGKCSTNRSAEAAPSNIVQCNNFLRHQWSCTNTQDCKQNAPADCEVTCSNGKCMSSTDEEEEEEEFANIEELLNVPASCPSLLNTPCHREGNSGRAGNCTVANEDCGYTCMNNGDGFKCKVNDEDEEGVTAN